MRSILSFSSAVYSRPALWLSAVLAGVFSALYIIYGSPSIQGWDSGEIQFLACQGGISHSIGYPLYLSLASWFCALPGAEPARGVTIFSAVCVSAALAVLLHAAHEVCRSFSARPLLPALAVGVIYGTTPIVWSTATTANVYSLFLLLGTIVLLLSLRWYYRGSLQVLLWAGVVLGLMAGSHGMALVIGLVYMLFAAVCLFTGRISLRHCLLLGGCVIAGALVGNLSLYWLRWYPHHPSDWLNKVIGHTLDLYESRSIDPNSFWSSWLFSAGNRQLPSITYPPGDDLSAFLGKFAWVAPLAQEQLSLVVFIFAAIGLLTLCMRSWPLAFLLLGLVLMPVSFTALASFPDKAAYYSLIPGTAVMLACAVGLANLLQHVWRGSRLGQMSFVVIVVAANFTNVKAPRADLSRDYEVGDTARAIVDCVTPDSLVFTEWFWVYPLEYEARIRRGYRHFEALESHPRSPSPRRFSRRYIDLITRELAHREIFVFEAEPEPQEVQLEYEQTCPRLRRVVSITDLKPEG